MSLRSWATPGLVEFAVLLTPGWNLNHSSIAQTAAFNQAWQPVAGPQWSSVVPLVMSLLLLVPDFWILVVLFFDIGDGASGRSSTEL